MLVEEVGLVPYIIKLHNNIFLFSRNFALLFLKSCQGGPSPGKDDFDGNKQASYNVKPSEKISADGYL